MFTKKKFHNYWYSKLLIVDDKVMFIMDWNKLDEARTLDMGWAMYELYIYIYLNSRTKNTKI